MDTVVEMHDMLVEDGSEYAAVVMHQALAPAEGPGAVIFPPTYAANDGNEDSGGYNIDVLRDGTKVALIDSVGSQANRMEPVFRSEKYRHLIPQVEVEANGRVVHIVDAGHRAADALVRFATQPEEEDTTVPLNRLLWDAFTAIVDQGNAEPLARIAPTSCVFGVWDSRATQAKLPRIIRSTIRGYDVEVLTRSAQYNPALRYVDFGIIKEDLDNGSGSRNPLSQEGFKHSPAVGSHGGIIVNGQIRREAIISLTAIRKLGVGRRDNGAYEDTLALRRYILGLSLVALLHRDDSTFDLREGCLLRYADATPVNHTDVKVARFYGPDMELSLNRDDVAAYATAVAEAFGVVQPDKPFRFEVERANEYLEGNQKDRETTRRTGPVIR